MRRTIFFASTVVLLMGIILAIAVVITQKFAENVQPTTSAVEAVPSNSTERITKPSKKLIEYGWDVPSPDFLRANIQAMEQRPFDGIVVKLNVGPYIFTHTPFANSSFTQDRQHLSMTSFNRFTDNFLIVWASSEQGWNFLSDSDWAAAEQNLHNFVQTAAAGGFKGILFDTETYGPNTWAYNTTLYPNTTFEQLQVVVCQRGARFMSILQKELPNARVLFTWFLGKIRDEYNATGGNIAQGPSPLFSAFVEGMFSTVSGDVKLIDGNEMSYNYMDAKTFDDSRIGLLDSINRVEADYQDAAHSHVSIGQAIYVDSLLNFLNSPRFIHFYLGSQQDRLLLVEHNVYHALRTSDEYAWFYSEHVDWWKTPNIPVGLEDALRQAREAYTSSQLPAYDMHFVEAAKSALGQAPTISGRVFTKEGGSVQQVQIQSGFYNLSDIESACYIDQNNVFDCKLPHGWSGTLTLMLQGYRFAPPVLHINNLTESRRVDFTAIPVTQ
jgi:hypothetical protein